MSITRRLVLAGASALALHGTPSFAFDKPEKTKLTLGAPVLGGSFLPLYIAADQTWKEQGLDVELVNFRTDTEASQALAGGSIDIGVVSGDGLISLVNSGQGCIGFYGGFNHADFVWLAQPGIKSWSDLKGSSVGVTGIAALTDQLTRYVLNKHGLAPERDVQIVAVGPGASGLQALRAGRLGAAILAPPYDELGLAAGMHAVGTQRDDVAPQWIRAIFVARRDFLDRNPNTVMAVLRAHVSALSLARTDRTLAERTLVTWMKITPEVAIQTYNAIMVGFDERGALPAGSMPAFWAVAKANNRLPDALPDSAIFDDRFVKSFAQWAP